MRVAVAFSGLLALVLTMGGLSGCASSKMPGWYQTPPSDPDHLYGVATATSKDMQMAINKAKTEAQTSLAQQLDTQLGNLTKQFQEEVGGGQDSELLQQFSSATKAVTNQSLVGAKIDQTKLVKEEGLQRAYVLMSLPIGAVNKLLVDKIKADQNLYTRFQATKAYEELNNELEKYEKTQK
jgi:hypothetical protein